MTIIQTLCYYSGIFVFGILAGVLCIITAEIFRRFGSRLAYKYYGQSRIRELYAFFDYVRIHEIESVQKYAESRNPLDAFILTRTALYLLKRNSNN